MDRFLFWRLDGSYLVTAINFTNKTIVSHNKIRYQDACGRFASSAKKGWFLLTDISFRI